MKKTNLLFLIFLSSCHLFEGPEGLKSLVDIIDEPSGTNCKMGGLKVTSGIDKNKNGQLDTDEITTTKFLCNPENGISSIIITSVESPGSNCPEGGIKIEVGGDLNSDGQLNQNEVQQTRFICNGSNGLTSLINSIPEPSGVNCAYGGTKLQSGIDINQNGQLDTDEIQLTKYVCNGKDGELDKEIRILLGNASGYNGTLYAETLFEFNIQNYPMVDSVTLVIFNIGTYDQNGQQTTFESTFQLFDATNNQVITNSKVVSDDVPKGSYVASRNILSYLPTGKVNLRIDIPNIPANSNINTISGPNYLILTRK